MNKIDLKKIIKFAKPLYRKTGKYHTWEHILRVRKHALRIAKKYKAIKLPILEASVYLHDIGRSMKNGDHVKNSILLSRKFLEREKIDKEDIGTICHAIESHDIKNILKAKTREAKILFDADKLEIASVNGFMRMCTWLVEERNFELHNAVNFLWDNIQKAIKGNYLRTREANKILKKEIPVLKKFVDLYNKWEKQFSK